MGPDGTWRSAMGATMTLHVAPDGALTGTYRSPTGHVSGAYPLLGLVDPHPDVDHGAAIGWTVMWASPADDAHSATTWCGRWTPDGVLRTTWLLTATGGEDWQATRVGHDVFVRDAATPDRDAAPDTAPDVEIARAGST